MTAAITVRLVTYNVRGLRDGAARVAGVLRALHPDVACLQEAPQVWRWRSRCARLARESGLVYVTGGNRSGGAVLLASHRAITAYCEDLPLPRTPGLAARGLAAAVFRIGDRRLAVASMHLGLNEQERQRHLDLVLGRVRALGQKHSAPHVLAGDVNEQPDGPAWQRLAAALTDGHAAAPRGGSTTFGRSWRIDGVFAGAGVEVLGCGVPDASDVPDVHTASDHRPVLAELRLPPT